MKDTMIKERICNLLESIVDKTENINKSDSPDYLLDVDLVIDELKQLYNEFILLKKVTEKQLEGETGRVDKTKISSTDPASRTFPRTFVTPPPGEKNQEDVKEEQKDEEQPSSKDSSVEVVSEENKQEVEETLSSKEHSAGKTSEKEETSKTDKDVATGAATVEKNSKMDEEHETKVDEAEKPEESKEVKEQSETSQKKSKNKNASIAETVGKSKSKFLGDKYASDEDTSLNKRLAKMKEDVTIGTRMQHKPIQNLKESIGVNEKFLFINELFEGDIEAYNDAINKLNSFSDIDEAFEFINQLNNTYAWDENHSSETIDKFAYLVQRRYMTN